MKNSILTIFIKKIICLFCLFQSSAILIGQCPVNVNVLGDNIAFIMETPFDNNNIPEMTFDFLGTAYDETVTPFQYSFDPPVLYRTTIEWVPMMQNYTSIEYDGNKCFYINSQLVESDPGPDMTTCEAIDHCAESLVPLALNAVDDSGCKKWNGACYKTADIQRNGKVGIGTDDIPNGFYMAVNGRVTTDRIHIRLCDQSNWCDYVFDDDYKLMELEDLNCFIEEYGHLPNTKSEQEMKKDGGYELKAVALNHLEKIEEVYLHLFSLQEKSKKLNSKLEKLNEENASLQSKTH